MTSKTFVLRDVPLSAVNAIRRTVLNAIPNVAASVKTMKFHEDTNIDVPNEFLKHRISLIPMNFSEKEIADFEPARYKFVLKVSNTTSSPLLITSKDIEIYNPEDGKKYSEAFHKRIFPADKISKDHILIARLGPNLQSKKDGETVNIEFSAEKNTAKTHVCFMPVSKCTFYNQIDEPAAAEARKKAANPSQFDVHERYRHFKKNERGEPIEFVFTIDSECALSPEYLFNQAVTILKKRLSSLIYNTVSVGNSYWEIVVDNEDSCIGNIINSSIFDRMQDPLIFVGHQFQTKHQQLVERIVIKLGFSMEMKENMVTTFFDQEVDHIVNSVLDISVQ